MSLLPQTLHGCTTFFAEGWEEKLKAHGITREAIWPEVKVGHCVSDSKRVKCFRLDISDREHVYYKTYAQRQNLMKFFMRPAKCASELFSYRKLKELGIPCPEVLAFGERRTLARLQDSFIVTSAIENSVDLEDYAWTTWRFLPATQKLAAYEQIFSQVADFTARAHAGNFFHYDLKWRNILIQEKSTGEIQTYWIDSPRGRVKKLNPQRGIVVDLSALSRLAQSYLSLSQRYRFLCRYLGQAGGPQVKALFREVNDHLSRRPPKILDFKQNLS